MVNDAVEMPAEQWALDRKRLSTDHVASIDGLRAIAVLAVVASHTFLLPGKIGERGVDLFFVISGLCLALPFLQSGKKIQPTGFWIKRFWRIVPAYWAALALFALLSLSAFGMPANTGPARHFELLQDLVLLTGFQPSYNPSFWTLGFEMHWYVLFPFVLALFLKSRPLFYGAILASYVWYLSPVRIPDAGMLPCFMLGIVAADLLVRKKIDSAAFVVLAIIFTAIAIHFDWLTADHGDPLWHLAAFFIVLAGIGAASKIMSWKPLAFVGAASYSIYLVNTPMLSWARDVERFPAGAAIAIAIGTGILFWALVERPLTQPEFRERVTSMFRAIFRSPGSSGQPHAVAATSAQP